MTKKNPAASLWRQRQGTLEYQPNNNNSSFPSDQAYSRLATRIPQPESCRKCSPLSSFERAPPVNTLLDHAVQYIRRGWSPVPIPEGKKGPRIKGWQNFRCPETDAQKYFSRGGNIGIILGEASGGLIDVDLDCIESIELAAKFLPGTDAIFGRPSKLASHRLYRVNQRAKSVRFKDPLTGEMLLELRGDGGLQTVFPPSIHPCDDPIAWACEGEPAIIDYAMLRAAATKLAACCLIRRYLPTVSVDTDLPRALASADAPVANQIRVWLKVPRPLTAQRDWQGSTASAQLFECRPGQAEFSPEPAYLQNLPVRNLAISNLEVLAEHDRVEWTPSEEARLRSALSTIPAVDRKTWFDVGAALHWTRWPNAFAIWCEWSRACPEKYDPADQERTWVSYDRPRSGALITIGTIYHLAAENGWKRDDSTLAFVWSEQTTATEAASQGAGRSNPRLNLIGGDELLSSCARPRSWTVERFVPAGETTMLSGDGGSGKTTIALQLSVALIIGGEWLGLKVSACKVLFVSAEDPADEIHFRLEQITKHVKVSKEALGRLKILDLAGKNATIATFGANGQNCPTPLFAEIENAACEHKVGCIIFDAVADFFGGNENERREVRAFVSALRGLAMRLNAAIIFIAHPSVDGIKTGRGYSGSTHWNNAVRSRLYFTDAPSEEGGGPPNPDLRMLELAKSNRARRGEKIHLIWEAGGFVTVTPGAVTNLTNEIEADRLFLELLSKMNKQGMNVSPNRSSNYAPVVLAKMPAAKGIGKAALERAMYRLLDKGAIRSEQFGPSSKVRQRLVVVRPEPGRG